MATGDQLYPEIEEFLVFLVVSGGRSEATARSYQGDLQRFAAFLSKLGKKIPEAENADIRDFVTLLRDGLSDATVARTISAVRGLYGYLCVNGNLSDDPTRNIRVRGANLVLPSALSVEEVARFLDSIEPVNAIGLRDRAMAETLYASGMRISELIGLDVNQIGGEWISVVGKGNKERLVPIAEVAQRWLSRYLNEGKPALARSLRAERAVFLSARGDRLTRQGAWYVLKSRARKVGLGQKFHPHVLRHSMATHMVEAGADLRVVQEILGHASVSTTEIYTKVSLAHLERVCREFHPRARL